MKSKSAEAAGDGFLKWGYAFAGACALGFAALIQVAFGGLDEEALANLPAIVTIPYGVAGKLGITVPLALLGVGLIVRDVLVNRNPTTRVLVGTPAARLGKSLKAPNAGTVPAIADDLEVGEPLADEVPPAPPAGRPGKKIAALPGGFGGRAELIPEATGGVVGDSPAPQRPGTGQVVLSSAKYLNKNPGGSFRRGSTNHTTDE